MPRDETRRHPLHFRVVRQLRLGVTVRLPRGFHVALLLQREGEMNPTNRVVWIAGETFT